MRKIGIIGAVMAVLAFTACDNENYMQYDSSNPARLQFGPIPENIYLKNSNYADTLKTHSFSSEPTTITRDTIYFDLYVVGGPMDKDRAFTVEQVEVAGVTNAVAGTHYVAFDDPTIKHEYTIPAGQAHIEMPVIMLRDTSLKTSQVTLKLQVVSNDQFLTGQTDLIWRKLIFSDQLMKPSNWDNFKSTLGTWSLVRHGFLIEATGQKWDMDFIKQVGTDSASLQYWLQITRDALKVYNDSHDPDLTDEFGKKVTF